MAVKSPRMAAYRILLPVIRDGMLLNASYRAHQETLSALPEQDRRFVRRLTKGVPEKKVALDAMLGRLLSKPLEKQRPMLLVLLYMGLYELLYMRTESYAAVNEYVKLAASEGMSGLKGLVNSVLRRADSGREDLLSALSRSERAGITPFLWKKLKEWYPDHYMTVAENLIDPDRPMTVRRMVSRVSEERLLSSLREEGVTAVPRTDVANAYTLSDIRDLKSLTAFRNGWFYVQDASSILAGDMVADLVRNAPEDAKTAVLDVCAAPGGKILRLADEAVKTAVKRLKKALARTESPCGPLTEQQLKMLMSEHYRFVACDRSAEKTALIEENMERFGFSFMETQVADAAEEHAGFLNAFDLVIADVPCSGIGIIGEKPDIQFHLSDASFRELELLQEKILERTVSCLKPGGTIAYSTCTLNPGENGEQVRRFLERHPDFELITERTCLPGIDDMRGFYMARLHQKDVHKT